MEGIPVGKIESIKSEPLYENDYQRYMFYKDNAETMGRLGQLPIEAAKVTAAFYESKAKECIVDRKPIQMLNLKTLGHLS